MKIEMVRKFPQRPPKPALGRGRLQIAARRGFYSNDVVTTGEIAQAAFVRRLLLHGQRLRPDHYRQVRRVLAAIAIPIGRGGGRGRPMLWQLCGKTP
jgi:hypothetical protein